MSKPEFSRRERQIMDVVYRLGEATASEILEEISQPPSYSGVRALLRVLEDKGHLQHREEGARYVYAPTVSREKASVGALKQVLKTFFEGSASQAVSALLGSSKRGLSKEELDELSALIEAERKKGR